MPAKLQRRVYQDDEELSILGFGAIVLMGMTPAAAETVVSEALAAGVNYFDTAPSYGNGEAEEKLGAALAGRRDEVFLACKTTARDGAAAERELQTSLARLQTSRLDLYQFHALQNAADVDQILAPGGAAEVFLEAQQAGVIRHIGFSAHGVDAALSLMARAKFRISSALFPLNATCAAAGNFGPQILAAARARGIACLALKGMVRQRWPEGVARRWTKAWYEPAEDAEDARRLLGWTLSQDITAAIPPGELALWRLALSIAQTFTPLDAAEQAAVLAEAARLTPIFSS